MDWGALQGVIRNWFVEASGLDAAKVSWADQDIERRTYPYATLALVSDGALGQDELSYVWDSDAEALIEHVQGVREFTISFKVECLSQSPASNARYYLTKARNDLKRSATIELFSAAGVALVDVKASLNADMVRALGMTSIGVMDLRLATMIDDYDAERVTAYVKTAEIEGTLDVPPDTTIGPTTYGDT